MFDIALAAVLLAALLPLLAALAIAIVLDSPGGILYVSPRVGMRGREFGMLKFRKMRLGAAGSPLTVDNDERFTRVGRFSHEPSSTSFRSFGTFSRGK